MSVINSMNTQLETNERRRLRLNEYKAVLQYVNESIIMIDDN